MNAPTTDEMINAINAMVPSKIALMAIEIKALFPSITDALKRNVSEKQIFDFLKGKWPDAHVATVTKLLNAERERRLRQGDQIDCKSFGRTRKLRQLRPATTGETSCAADHGEEKATS